MLQAECITESGSTVKLYADGWAQYQPSVESSRRTGLGLLLGPETGVLKTVEAGQPIVLEIDDLVHGKQLLRTSPVAEIRVSPHVYAVIATGGTILGGVVMHAEQFGGHQPLSHITD